MMRRDRAGGERKRVDRRAGDIGSATSGSTRSSSWSRRTSLLGDLPLGEERAKAVVRGREEVVDVLDGSDDRLLVVVGPCSVHDVDAALEYASGSPSRRGSCSDDLLIAMRVYFEKPRTTTGWKGLINDPHLDGSGDVNAGLRMARALLLEVLDLGLPVGCEFLDPITPQYISDAVAWGAIGARTTESQIHRQLGSGLSMPIGFKNRTDGNVQVAVDAVRAAAAPHAFAGIDDSGAAGDPAHRPATPTATSSCAAAAARPTTAPQGSRSALAKLARRRAARAGGDRRLPRQQRQGPRAPGRRGRRDRRADRRRQRGDRRRDARVLPRRGPPGPRRRPALTYGQSITDACMDWERDRLGARPAGRGGPGAARRMRIAVLGVGLIGGSIGLAARAAAARPRWSASTPTRATLDRAVELGAIDRRPTRSRRPARAPSWSSAPRRWRPCRSWRARRSTPAAGDAWSPTSARPSARSSPRWAATSASSAATRWPGRRPPGSRTPAPTSSRARAGT